MHGLALIFMYLCTFVSASSWPPVAMAHVHCGMWRAGSCCRVSTVTQLMSCPWTSPHLRLETLLSLGWERKREREKYSVDWFEIYVVFFRGNPVIHFFVFGFHWTMMKKLGFYWRTTIFSLCACVCLFICMCVFVLSGLWYEGQCVGHALWTEHSIFREPRVWHQLREVGPTLLKSLSESQFLDFTNEKWIISLTDIKKL